ncbi:hypothetical protein IFR05_011046, partial [Cadophora sp. M221]
RLLARRIVHFTSEEMIWECKSEQTCECGRISGSQKGRSEFENLLEMGGKSWESWKMLLTRYTTLQLSTEEDRLPALSGIASQLFEPSDYLAVISRRWIHNDPCWKRDRTSGATRTSRQAGAPTWSWASINCPISWAESRDYPTARDSLRIIEASYRARGENLFGQVLSGHTPVFTQMDHIRHPGIPHHSLGVLRLDCTAFENSYLEPQPVFLLVCYNYQHEFNQDRDSSEADVDGGSNKDIQMIYGRISKIWTFMLVLRRLQNEEGTYQRIGVAEYPGDLSKQDAEVLEPITVKVVYE